MGRHLVYDLPTRAFHWMFSGLFLTAFVIVKAFDDDSPVYVYHMLAGLTLSFLVLLRIVWGFTGTQHARFSGFALNPKDLVRYFQDMFTGKTKRYAGHNPASSWAGLTMMFFALGLGVTGYLMTSGGGTETYEDIHELFSDGFAIVVVLHTLGIAVHTIRHKEVIGLSMIDGKKSDIASQDVVGSSQWFFGMLLIALVVSFGFKLYKNYDPGTGQVAIFGATLHLGESELSEAGPDSNSESDENSSDDD